MKKTAKRSKKGFTSVELIVVLVILAVLAAMLVPALVGYIDRAKKEKEYQAASTVYAGVQALLTEAYGKSTAVTTNITTSAVEKLTGIKVNAIKFNVKDNSDSAEAVDKYTVEDIAIQFKDGENWYTYTRNDASWGYTETSTISGTFHYSIVAPST